MIYSIYLNKIVKVFKLSVYILTGQIGCGKSEAQKIFQNLKYSCFCADKIVRDLYKKDQVLCNIRQILPESIKDGKINFNLLRELIFTDNIVMKKIEDYIQPLVFDEFQKILKLYDDKTVLIFPTIKCIKIFGNHKTIYMYSDEKLRRKRIESRNNYNKDIIDSIFIYQNSIDNYIDKSDFVIENNGSLKELKEKILKIIK